ncbi:MAG: hypothetical protein LBK75_04885 [Oscillospiraceae bacterium]|nr:hypothetical protein [Oscillospiraceae bacterium]
MEVVKAVALDEPIVRVADTLFPPKEPDVDTAKTLIEKIETRHTMATASATHFLNECFIRTSVFSYIFLDPQVQLPQIIGITSNPNPRVAEI